MLTNNDRKREDETSAFRKKMLNRKKHQDMYERIFKITLILVVLILIMLIMLTYI